MRSQIFWLCPSPQSRQVDDLLRGCRWCSFPDPFRTGLVLLLVSSLSPNVPPRSPRGRAPQFENLCGMVLCPQPLNCGPLTPLSTVTCHLWLWTFHLYFLWPSAGSIFILSIFKKSFFSLLRFCTNLPFLSYYWSLSTLLLGLFPFYAASAPGMSSLVQYSMPASQPPFLPLQVSSTPPFSEPSSDSLILYEQFRMQLKHKANVMCTVLTITPFFPPRYLPDACCMLASPILFLSSIPKCARYLKKTSRHSPGS